jgi:hypothetical protein
LFEKNAKKRKEKKSEVARTFFPGLKLDIHSWLCQVGILQLLGSIKD